MKKNKELHKKWHFSKQVKTPDDFCPSFPDGTVSCSVILMSEFHKMKPCVRVCVWGDDDFGLARDEFFDNNGTAKTIFRKRKMEVSKWNNITKKQLKEAGFIRD